MSPMRQLFAASTIVLAASSALAAEIQIQSQGPVIELTVSQTVNARPDTAVVGAGVQTRAMMANEAARLNAVKMDAIIAKLAAMGIAKDDIQTSNFSISPQFQYSNTQEPPRFLGYDVSNQVSVKLRKMDRIGATLDALIAAGANNFFGPNFMLEADGSAKTAARKAAFADASARGRELASLAGYSGLRLLEVSENYASNRPMAMDSAANVVAVSAEKRTPIEPGQVGTMATLTVKYEMTR